MRRFDFPNNADTTKNYSQSMTRAFHLTLPPTLPSPSPNLPLCKAFSHTSNRHAPQSGLRKKPVVIWKANKLYKWTSGQSRSHLYPEDRGQERWRCTYRNKQLAPFLPRFYPVLEGKMRRGKKEGKNGVNSFYPGVKPG